MRRFWTIALVVAVSTAPVIAAPGDLLQTFYNPAAPDPYDRFGYFGVSPSRPHGRRAEVHLQVD